MGAGEDFGSIRRTAPGVWSVADVRALAPEALEEDVLVTRFTRILDSLRRGRTAWRIPFTLASTARAGTGAQVCR